MSSRKEILTILRTMSAYTEVETEAHPERSMACLRSEDSESHLPGECDFSCGSLLKSSVRKYQNAHDSCLLGPFAPSPYKAFFLK